MAKPVFCDKSAKIRNIYPQSNPSVSHTLDSSPYTGEPLEVDFFDTLKKTDARRHRFFHGLLLSDHFAAVTAVMWGCTPSYQ